MVVNLVTNVITNIVKDTCVFVSQRSIRSLILPFFVSPVERHWKQYVTNSAMNLI